MSTAPIVPVVPAKQTQQQKFESFWTNFGAILKNIANAAVNIAQEEAPIIEPLLPPAIGAALAKVLSAAATQVGYADAKYAAIEGSDVPFGVKVAEAVAVGGAGVLAIAAVAGLEISSTQLPQFFGAAFQIASVLNLANITAAPAAPAAPVAS
jgi:hypothetical protein